MNQSIMMDFEIVTFWGRFWVRKGIMKWMSTILFWTTVMIFGTQLWEYGLILVAPVDFEIITWFGFAWMPDPAGGAGRTFKSRMCTFVSGDRLEPPACWTWKQLNQNKFSNKEPWCFLFPVGPLRERSRSHFPSDTGPSSAGERARHTWQLWLFCGDRLEPPASWAWKQLNHLETKQFKQKNMMIF